jgi:hypothetical protein
MPEPNAGGYNQNQPAPIDPSIRKVYEQHVDRMAEQERDRQREREQNFE